MIAGASLVYAAYENFVPYLGVSLSWLWGDFRMTETMGDLQGTQIRKIKQKGLIRISLGTTFQLARQFSLRGEAGIIPAKGGTDLERLSQASLWILTGKEMTTMTQNRMKRILAGLTIVFGLRFTFLIGTRTFGFDGLRKREPARSERSSGISVQQASL